MTISEQPPEAPTAAPTLAPTPIPSPTPVIIDLINEPNETWAQQAADYGAGFLSVDKTNSGIWQYPQGSFRHPIAFQRLGDTAYLIDAGRVLALDLVQPQAPQPILSPMDTIEGITVLEPLDLSIEGQQLFVLDRAGDVYRYDIPTDVWSVDRYDRPVDDESGNYYVAVDAVENGRYLLEGNYVYALRYGMEQNLLWTLPTARAVDISVQGDDAYTLFQEMDSQAGWLKKYRDTQQIKWYRAAIDISQPRQLNATPSTIYILDQDGYRLLLVDAESGALLKLLQLPQQDPVSAFWVSDAGESLLLAGQDRLYFYDQPGRLAVVPGEPAVDFPRSYDPTYLAQLPPLVIPIAGSEMTPRDLQMPGAPRHYRLGIHEGTDLYWQPGTMVRAIADGQIIRANHDYQPATPALVSYWRAETLLQGYTPEEALDFYRGMQVWIQHENGFITRYGHLSQISPDVVVGTTVVQGQTVGAVGNSGSPMSLNSDSTDAHLHFELWLQDHFVGQYLRPIEIRGWIERLMLPEE